MSFQVPLTSLKILKMNTFLHLATLKILIPFLGTALAMLRLSEKFLTTPTYGCLLAIFKEELLAARGLPIWTNLD
jgi:hypothetical protein